MMAILEGPLYGTEAKGKIKSNVTFFPRSANPLCTDEGEDVWYHLKAMGYRKESSSPARETQKNKFRDALEIWYFLTPSDKAYWDSQAVGLETGFNAFLKDYLLTN